jgi:hypothetical protein
MMRELKILLAARQIFKRLNSKKSLFLITAQKNVCIDFFVSLRGGAFDASIDQHHY